MPVLDLKKANNCIATSIPRRLWRHLILIGDLFKFTAGRLNRRQMLALRSIPELFLAPSVERENEAGAGHVTLMGFSLLNGGRRGEKKSLSSEPVRIDGFRRRRNARPTERSRWRRRDGVTAVRPRSWRWRAQWERSRPSTPGRCSRRRLVGFMSDPFRFASICARRYE